MEAYIFDNPAFLWGTGTICSIIFGADFYREHKNKIRSLKYSYCFNGINSFKELGEFAAGDLPLTPAVWMNLRSCLLRTRNQLTSTININLAKPIENFLSIPTKGSKRFRKFFERNNSENLRANRCVTTFYGLIDLPVPILKTLKTCVTLWSHNLIGNDIRDFFLKCRQNYLPLNNRRAAYDLDVNPLCTFCRIRDLGTANRESFDHLFFSCPTTRAIIDNIITNLFNVAVPNEFKLKQFIWNGVLENNDEINFPLIFFGNQSGTSSTVIKLGNEFLIT
jgi:hypothetical protein